MTNEATVSTTANYYDDNTGIGQRLREARERAGLSQRALAFPGCSAAYISRIEAGARVPSPRVIRGLSERLAVSESFLATGDIEVAAEREADPLIDAEVALRLDDTELAQRLYEEALEGAASSETRARALAGLGQLSFGAGDTRTAIDRLEEALELAPEVETPSLADTLGRAYADVGDRAAAIALFERHLKLAEARNDRVEMIRFGVLLANARIDNSEFGEAAELLARTIQLTSETRDPLLQARLFWSQSRLHALQNEPETAARYARRALAVLEQTEHTQYTARAYHLLAFIELDRGRAEEALELVRTGRHLLRGAGTLLEEAAFRLEEARALAKLGRRDEAAELAMTVAGQIAEADPIEVGRSFALLAQTFEEAGDHARASELYELAVELLEATPTRYLVDVYARFGELLERTGKRDEAFDLYKRAVLVQQRIGISLSSDSV